MSTTQALDIIRNHIRIEVLLGHDAIGVYISLSEHSSALNKLSLRYALGTIQRHALDAFILSLCKLYEKPSSKYPNFSIPTTLKSLNENPSDLAADIRHNCGRLEKFIQARVDRNFAVSNSDDITRIPTLVLKYFSDQCPRTPPRNGNELDHILDALKVLRDKRVAHHEATDIAPLRKTHFNGALKLLAFAQTYVNLVGYGFFGFSQEGEVGAEKFDPRSSVVWPEMNLMIGLIGQSAA